MKSIASVSETRRNSLVIPVAAMILYVGISFILLHGWRMSGAATIGAGGDTGSYLWFLNWWPWSLGHHVNPFQTNFVWYPSGQNMAWTASVPALSLLASPITLLAGPVWSFNILTLLAPALGAWTAFLLFRHVTGSIAAALVAGFFFGFSAYETGQLIGHLNLDAVFLIPAMLYVALLRLEGAMSRRVFIGGLGVLLALQAGISTEVFATSVFFGAVAWGVFLWLGAPEDRPGLQRLVIEIAAAGALCALLISPLLFYVFRDMGHVPSDNSPAQYSTDALNFVVPSGVTRIGGEIFSKVSAQFTGNSSEQGAYLGLPALLILAVFFIRNLERPRLRALLVMLVLLAICSLGPQLQVAGVNTGLPLPWAIGVKLPFLKHALPCRFTAFTALAAALGLALFLAREGGQGRRIGKYALAGLACFCLMPNPKVLGWAPVSNMPFFDRANVEAELGRNPNVMILPYGYFATGMVWQVQSGMSFTQTGGYLGVVPRPEFAIDRWPIIGELLNGVAGPNFAHELLPFCQAHHVTAILVTPDAPQGLVDAIRPLNWANFTSKGVVVYRVPLAAGTDRPVGRPG